MRILLYEWCCSGGLVADDAPIAREGRLMLEALAADATRDKGATVTVLADERAMLDLPPGVRTVTVRPGDDAVALVAAARDADWTLIVAPETDGILADRVAAVRTSGGRVLAPAPRFIAIAADKQATIDALAAAGLPVPAGRALAADAPWPAAFARPAIRKPRFGVGCAELVRVDRGAAPPPASAAPTRLEACAAGLPVGVSCICGPTRVDPLPTMRQVFAAAGATVYVGGEPIADTALDRRARSLAIRAIAAVARAAGDAPGGWIGVDMILGRRPDGRDDRVLEVNPRFTTSFVGHARGLSASLVRVMLEAAAGSPPRLSGTPLPFRVKADDDIVAV